MITIYISIWTNLKQFNLKIKKIKLKLSLNCPNLKIYL